MQRVLIVTKALTPVSSASYSKTQRSTQHALAFPLVQKSIHEQDLFRDDCYFEPEVVRCRWEETVQTVGGTVVPWEVPLPAFHSPTGRWDDSRNTALWSYTLWNIVHFHKSSTQGALSLLEESPVIVCNAQFYTIPIVQAIEQECIAHRQCAVTQNNERFCRGGLSSAVTITGRVEGWLNIYRRNSCRQPQPLLQTLSTVTMSSIALI